MNRGQKTFCSENKKDLPLLTAIPAHDIIIANTRRVVCSQCGFLIGRAKIGASTAGTLYYCRKCKDYRLIVSNTDPVP